jgi:hypothetical protein
MFKKTLLSLSVTFLVAVAAGQPAANSADTATSSARNVIVITTDGFRWQDLFRGADADMMTTENQVKNPKALLSEYGGDTPEARRAKLMPFLWSYVASHGQIYGNRDKGSIDHVTNQMWFSYPGYNELLTGHADDKRINSIKMVPNPNVTVFEWLNKKPEIAGHVAAFSSWGVHAAIFNSGRCGFPVDAGGRQFDPPTGLTCGMEMINRVRESIPFRGGTEAFDAVVYPMFIEYLKTQKPRLAVMGFIETDAWGHEGNYEQYLTAAHRVDGFLKQLWEQLQSMPEYRDNTTIIFTCDHGRGDTAQSLKAWNSHGKKIDGSDAIFMAIWGPDTPAKGEITSGEITQSQIAATVAKAMGYDYNADHPKAGQPVPGAIQAK